jgi:ABC-type multidrug transport system fused ATPase/permease subunit
MDPSEVTTLLLSESTPLATRDLFTRLRRYLTQQQRMLMISAASMLVASGVQVLLPVLGRDIVELGSGPGLSVADVSQRCLALCCAVALFHATSFAGHYAAVVGAQAAVASMHADGFRCLLDADASVVLRSSAAHNTAVITKAGAIVFDLVTGSLTNLVQSAVALVGFLAMVVYISPQLSLAFAVVVGGVLGALRVARTCLFVGASRGAEEMSTLSEVTTLTSIATQRCSTFRLFPAAVVAYRARYSEALHHWTTARRGQQWSIHSNAGLESCLVTCAVVCLIGGTTVARSRGLIDVLDLVVYFFYLVQLVSRGQSIATETAKVEVLLRDVSPFFRLCDDADSKRASYRGVIPGLPTYSLCFDHVYVAAVATGTVLFSDFAATAPATRGGQMVALAGPSGSGKTSLLRSIAGTLDVRATQGRILAHPAFFAKHEPRPVLLEQGAQLLPGSLRFNIQIGKRGPMTEAELLDAARRAGCLDFIASRPRGFDTLVDSPDAASFSGGQVQRILLARAFASDSKIVLLDEPTTGLDAISAGHVRTAMRALVADGRLVCVATHDDALLNDLKPHVWRIRQHLD